MGAGHATRTRRHVAQPGDELREETTTVEISDASRWDVFLSYNARDLRAVERIAERLKRAGVDPWFDRWCQTPGVPWQQEVAAALGNCAACALFIGPSDLGGWEHQELQVALLRAVKEPRFRVFPVLLPGVAETFDASALPPFLSMRTWVDLRPGRHAKPEVEVLIDALRGLPSGPRRPLTERDDASPYPGLRTFEEHDAEFYFGREAEQQRLAEKVKSTRFVAVVGASGSGKSSLVRAGLLPWLHGGGLPGSETWPIHLLTPGPQPLTVLGAALLRLTERGAMSDTVARLAEDPASLHLATALAMADRPTEERAVWVVDQCEEVFTLCYSEAERQSFLTNLLYAAAAPGGRSIVVITLRADFYQRMAEHREFAQAIAAHQLLVGPLQRDGIRQAIEEPARLAGLDFEDGLIETIISEVGTDPGSLPLLQHALLELWKRRWDRLLTLKGYRDSGGVEGAVAQRAEDSFSAFSPEQQAIARRALLRLTQPGEGTEDTRRRAELSELSTHRADEDAVQTVVRDLVDARLLTTSGGMSAGEQWVEVAHEALIRGWPRLRAWIEEERDGLRIHRRLTEAAQDWARSHRDLEALYRGVRLVEALDWRERNQEAINQLEDSFLQTSRELRDRERRDLELRQERELREAIALATARRRARRRLALAPVLGASVGLLLLFTSVDAAVEDWTLDVRTRLQPSATPSNLLVVGIDDKTFSKLRLQWPFPRRWHARAIDRLRRDGARVIVYDVQFTEPTTTRDDNALIDAVDRAHNVVLATAEADRRGRTNVLGGAEVLKSVGAQAGSNIVLNARAGLLRRFGRTHGGVPTLATVTSDLVGRAPPRSAFEHGGAWIDFRGPPGTIDTVSFSDLLNGRVDPARVRGRIVVVGAGPTLKDGFATPTSDQNMAAPEVQANTIWTALHNNPLSSAPRWLGVLVVLIASCAVPAVAARARLALAVGAALLLAALLPLAAYLAFGAGMILPVTAPVAALAAAAVTAMLKNA